MLTLEKSNLNKNNLTDFNSLRMRLEEGKGKKTAKLNIKKATSKLSRYEYEIDIDYNESVSMLAT